jgi:hypothetical protein
MMNKLYLYVNLNLEFFLIALKMSLAWYKQVESTLAFLCNFANVFSLIKNSKYDEQNFLP